MAKFTRRRLLATAAPFAAAPALVKFAGSDAQAAHDHSRHMAHHTGHAGQGHAAMIGAAVPAVGGPNDLDALLYPPKALPYKPGRVREYDLERSTVSWKSRPVSSSLPGRTTGPCPGR